MYAYGASNTSWDSRPQYHTGVIDAGLDQGEEDEAYDFDPVELPRNHYSTISHRRPSHTPGSSRGASVGPGRAPSVGSEYSTGTTGHFITPSQAGSPSYIIPEPAKLSDRLEARLSRVLDSPPSNHVQVSPKLAVTQRQSPIPQVDQFIPISKKKPKKRWKLPSFQSLLRSLGESTTSSSNQSQYRVTQYPQRSMSTSAQKQGSRQVVVPADHTLQSRISTNYSRPFNTLSRPTDPSMSFQDEATQVRISH